MVEKNPTSHNSILLEVSDELDVIALEESVKICLDLTCEAKSWQLMVSGRAIALGL